jgi:hypothetical protein
MLLAMAAGPSASTKEVASHHHLPPQQQHVETEQAKQNTLKEQKAHPATQQRPQQQQQQQQVDEEGPDLPLTQPCSPAVVSLFTLHDQAPPPQQLVPAQEAVRAPPAGVPAAADGGAGQDEPAPILAARPAAMRQVYVLQAQEAFASADSSSPASMLRALKLLMLAGHGGEALRVRSTLSVARGVGSCCCVGGLQAVEWHALCWCSAGSGWSLGCTYAHATAGSVQCRSGNV